MAYEFELKMKALAIETLKTAHEAFLTGDCESYSERLREAASAIDGIGRLGLSPDNPRFLWVDRLTCDWKLIDTLRCQRSPSRLIRLYGECRYPPSPASLVLGRDSPYLPYDCTDVYEYYAAAGQDEELISLELSHAMELYAALTNGGGAGVDLLYKAGLALRQGEAEKAALLAKRARELAPPWLEGCIQTLLRQIDEED